MEITVQELKNKMEHGESLTLIDVREPKEYAICYIQGAKLIPLKELPGRVEELDPNDLTILYCHRGGRSAHATLWLKQNGFENVKNLLGGIDAWAKSIDPKMKRY